MEALPLRKIVGFTSTLFITGTLYSHSNVQQGRKYGVQGAKAVDLAVVDNFLHSSTQLSAFSSIQNHTYLIVGE